MLDPLLELISAFSHEPQQSDGELYQKIVESYRRDEVTYALCMGSLTGPKERNMKMLLRPKNLPMVTALNSLIEIPAMMEQLLLGSLHKWLALHIDEQIIHYLNHISVVWKEKICQGKKTIMQSLDIDSIRILQLRMPTVCSADAETIKRRFDDGTLFPGVIDPGDRDMLRQNVLSLNMVIPSFETLQENLHYVGFAAKILIRHVVDQLPLCKSSKKRSPTIFEVLSSSWTHPEIVKVEADDGKLTEIEGPASPSLAFTQLCLACLRLFPWLQDALPPREDWPQDNFKADVIPQCVAYVLQLAFELGFRTSKIQAAMSQSTHPGLRAPFSWQEIPDWRGGRPFTRTFWYLRTSGFLPKLAVTRRRQPNPEFVLLDMMTAFFGKHAVILKDGSSGTHIDEPIVEETALGLSEDTNMDGSNSGGNAVSPEDGQRGGAAVAPRARGDKIRPRSRYFGSASNARQNKAASATINPPRKDAAGIPKREAARSVMGRQALARRRAGGAAGGDGAVPVSDVATSGRGAAQSAEVAPTQLTGSSAPKTSQQAAVQNVQNPLSQPLGHTKKTVPTFTFREVARSVFVAKPNWEGSTQGIADALALASPQPSRLASPTTRPDQESRRAAVESVSTRDAPTPSVPPLSRPRAFRPAIPPIRGMITKKPAQLLGKHPRSETDISTIRQEMSEEPARKRVRPPLAAEEPASLSTLPVPSDSRDEDNSIATKEQRKRDAVLWDKPVIPMLVEELGEGGGPSAQSNPLPVVLTTRADLSFIDEEEEDEEDEVT